MLTLVIDSCTERGLVAFVDGEKILYMAGLPFGLHNSTFLVPKIDEGLQILGLKPAAIELISIASGPGSYTGIRVGVAAAKSLAYSCKIPLVGVFSLQGFIPDREGIFAAIFDAKMGGCYLMKGIRSGEDIHYISSPEVHLMEPAKEVLKGVEIIVSPNCRPLQEKMGENPFIWEETGPDPLHISRLANQKFQAGEFSTDGSVDILYMR